MSPETKESFNSVHWAKQNWEILAIAARGYSVHQRKPVDTAIKGASFENHG